MLYDIVADYCLNLFTQFLLEALRLLSTAIRMIKRVLRVIYTAVYLPLPPPMQFPVFVSFGHNVVVANVLG